MKTFPSRKIYKPRIKESDIQNRVKSLLELKGFLVIETHGPFNRPAHEGITDIIAVKYGFVAWIECKRPSWNYCKIGNVPSRTEVKEVEFKEKIKRAGGTWALIQTYDEAEADIEVLAEKAEAWKKFKYRIIKDGY